MQLKFTRPPKLILKWLFGSFFGFVGLLIILINSSSVDNIEITNNNPLLDQKFMAKTSLAKLKKAIRAGADLHAKNINDETPLHYAVKNQDAKIINSLIAQGISVNVSNINTETPLHYAALYDKVAKTVLIALLDHGAEVNARNVLEQTPLHYAGRNNSHSNTMQILLEHGAEDSIDLTDENTLDMAAEINPHLDVIKYIVTKLPHNKALYLTAEEDNENVDVTNFLKSRYY